MEHTRLVISLQITVTGSGLPALGSPWSPETAPPSHVVSRMCCQSVALVIRTVLLRAAPDRHAAAHTQAHRWRRCRGACGRGCPRRARRSPGPQTSPRAGGAGRTGCPRRTSRPGAPAAATGSGRRPRPGRRRRPSRRSSCWPATGGPRGRCPATAAAPATHGGACPAPTPPGPAGWPAPPPAPATPRLSAAGRASAANPGGRRPRQHRQQRPAPRGQLIGPAARGRTGGAGGPAPAAHAQHAFPTAPPMRWPRPGPRSGAARAGARPPPPAPRGCHHHRFSRVLPPPLPAYPPRFSPVTRAFSAPLPGAPRGMLWTGRLEGAWRGARGGGGRATVAAMAVWWGQSSRTATVQGEIGGGGPSRRSGVRVYIAFGAGGGDVSRRRGRPVAHYDKPETHAH